MEGFSSPSHGYEDFELADHEAKVQQESLSDNEDDGFEVDVTGINRWAPVTTDDNFQGPVLSAPPVTNPVILPSIRNVATRPVLMATTINELIKLAKDRLPPAEQRDYIDDLASDLLDHDLAAYEGFIMNADSVAEELAKLSQYYDNKIQKVAEYPKADYYYPFELDSSRPPTGTNDFLYTALVQQGENPTPEIVIWKSIFEKYRKLPFADVDNVKENAFTTSAVKKLVLNRITHVRDNRDNPGERRYEALPFETDVSGVTRFLDVLSEFDDELTEPMSFDLSDMKDSCVFEEMRLGSLSEIHGMMRSLHESVAVRFGMQQSAVCKNALMYQLLKMNKRTTATYRGIYSRSFVLMLGGRTANVGRFQRWQTCIQAATREECELYATGMFGKVLMFRTNNPLYQLVIFPFFALDADQLSAKVNCPYDAIISCVNTANRVAKFPRKDLGSILAYRIALAMSGKMSIAKLLSDARYAIFNALMMNTNFAGLVSDKLCVPQKSLLGLHALKHIRTSITRHVSEATRVRLNTRITEEDLSLEQVLPEGGTIGMSRIYGSGEYSCMQDYLDDIYIAWLLPRTRAQSVHEYTKAFNAAVELEGEYRDLVNSGNHKSFGTVKEVWDSQDKWAYCARIVQSASNSMLDAHAITPTTLSGLLWEHDTPVWEVTSTRSTFDPSNKEVHRVFDGVLRSIHGANHVVTVQEAAKPCYERGKCDVRVAYKVGQVAATRELFVMSLPTKYATRLTENIMKNINEQVPLTLITKTPFERHKRMHDSYMAAMNIKLSSDVYKYHQLHQLTMDASKWSTGDNLDVYLDLLETLKSKITDEQYKVVHGTITAYKHRRVFVKDSLLASDKTHELLPDSAVSKTFVTMVSGWPQGNFNFMSSYKHACVSYLVTKIVERLGLAEYFDHFSASDDSYGVALVPSACNLTLIRNIIRMVSKLFCIRENDKKSCNGLYIGEYNSIWNFNGQICYPEIKRLITCVSGLPFTGPFDDYSYIGNKVAELAQFNISTSTCLVAELMMTHYVAGLYSMRPGQSNQLHADPFKVHPLLGGIPYAHPAQLALIGDIAFTKRLEHFDTHHEQCMRYLYDVRSKWLPFDTEDEHPEDLDSLTTFPRPSVNMRYGKLIDKVRSMYRNEYLLHCRNMPMHIKLFPPRNDPIVAQRSMIAKLYTRSYRAAYSNASKEGNLMRVAGLVKKACVSAGSDSFTLLEFFKLVGELYAEGNLARVSEDSAIAYANGSSLIAGFKDLTKRVCVTGRVYNDEGSISYTTISLNPGLLHADVPLNFLFHWYFNREFLTPAELKRAHLYSEALEYLKREADKLTDPDEKARFLLVACRFNSLNKRTFALQKRHITSVPELIREVLMKDDGFGQHYTVEGKIPGVIKDIASSRPIALSRDALNSQRVINPIRCLMCMYYDLLGIPDLKPGILDVVMEQVIPSPEDLTLKQIVTSRLIRERLGLSLHDRLILSYISPENALDIMLESKESDIFVKYKEVAAVKSHVSRYAEVKYDRTMWLSYHGSQALISITHHQDKTPDVEMHIDMESRPSFLLVKQLWYIGRYLLGIDASISICEFTNRDRSLPGLRYSKHQGNPRLAMSVEGHIVPVMEGTTYIASITHSSAVVAPVHVHEKRVVLVPGDTTLVFTREDVMRSRNAMYAQASTPMFFPTQFDDYINLNLMYRSGICFTTDLRNKKVPNATIIARHGSHISTCTLACQELLDSDVAIVQKELCMSAPSTGAATAKVFDDLDELDDDVAVERSGDELSDEGAPSVNSAAGTSASAMEHENNITLERSVDVLAGVVQLVPQSERPRITLPSAPDVKDYPSPQLRACVAQVGYTRSRITGLFVTYWLCLFRLIMHTARAFQAKMDEEASNAQWGVLYAMHLAAYAFASLADNSVIDTDGFATFLNDLGYKLVELPSGERGVARFHRVVKVGAYAEQCPVGPELYGHISSLMFVFPVAQVVHKRKKYNL